ncbi:MAG: cobyric acid synthase CobQ, partial [Chlorobium sp.]
GKVIGTYFHGIFDEPAVKEWFLTLLDPSWRPLRAEMGHQESYELLADHFREHLDLKKFFNLVGLFTDAE